MKPTIGRIVHYHSVGGLNAEVHIARAAIITVIHGDGEMVDLTVFKPGAPTAVAQVKHGEGQGQWSWPPRD